ncbi:MAG: EI24 domain-containing protein [Bacteroidetes bacterium]|nr:EI24 domain-containing protein [Bacteroidota bacterium]MBU1717883.1 EI24 domain-containing protein [Bacteroidota bacterium]
MKFIKHLYIGYASYWQAIRFIIKHNMWLYFIVPVILLVGIYFGGEYVFDEMVKNFDFSRVKDLDFSDLSESDELYRLLFLSLEILAVFIAVKLGNYVVLNVLTPMLTMLSTKTDTLLTGNRFPITTRQYFQDIGRALRLQFRNMLIFVGWIAVWYLISLVLLPFEDMLPVSKVVLNKIAIFLIGAYFFGFTLLDYTNERRRLTIAESIKFVRKHAGIAWALGSVYSAFFFFPYVGVVVAPVLCVVAATLATSKVVDLSKNPYAKPAKKKGVEKKEK